MISGSNTNNVTCVFSLIKTSVACVSTVLPITLEDAQKQVLHVKQAGSSVAVVIAIHSLKFAEIHLQTRYTALKLTVSASAHL